MPVLPSHRNLLCKSVDCMRSTLVFDGLNSLKSNFPQYGNESLDLQSDLVNYFIYDASIGFKLD